MSSHADDRAARPGARRILVVDEPAVANLTADYLTHFDEDLAVDTARDRRTTLAERSLGQYDCVVIGHYARGQNGLALCREVRAAVPGLPVVLFSSVDPDRAVLEAEATMSAVAFVRKGGRAGQYERLAKQVDALVAEATPTI